MEQDIFDYVQTSRPEPRVTTETRLEWLEKDVEDLASGIERLEEKTAEVLEQCAALGEQVQATNGHLAALWKLGVAILVLLVSASLRLVGWM